MHCVPACCCTQMHTSSSLPQSPEPFLSHDLPEAIDDSSVRGLSCPRCNLQTRLDDISRRHEGGSRDTWEMEKKIRGSFKPVKNGVYNLNMKGTFN